MKLTEKCKEAFITWMCKNYPEIKWHEYETMPECVINSFIIEFFYSVGIYITILPCIDKTFDSYVTMNEKRIEVCQFQPTRIEAINAAIEKANVIYNESKL